MELYEQMKEEDVYTWPNPHFPFKCLLDHKECRVFILENIPHNYTWLDKHKNSIRETDFFFVTLGWFLSQHLANQSSCILAQLNLNRDNFYILYNSPEEESNGTSFGLRGSVINHNAWLNEQDLRRLPLAKKYRALYIARPTDFKRHYLAREIKGLALAAGGFNHRTPQVDLPPADNDTGNYLTKKEICEIINESHCGLCLSREEGACYSSSEYLLCGIPVVSTWSLGGRDVWYNEYNSIICEDTPEAVAEAVTEAVHRKWDASLIREMHQSQASGYRNKFLGALQDVLNRLTSPTVDAERVFKENFTWYCNSNSNATPHLRDVESYFTK